MGGGVHADVPHAAVPRIRLPKRPSVCIGSALPTGGVGLAERTRFFARPACHVVLQLRRGSFLCEARSPDISTEATRYTVRSLNDDAGLRQATPDVAATTWRARVARHGIVVARSNRTRVRARPRCHHRPRWQGSVRRMRAARCQTTSPCLNVSVHPRSCVFAPVCLCRRPWL